LLLKPEARLKERARVVSKLKNPAMAAVALYQLKLKSEKRRHHMAQNWTPPPPPSAAPGNIPNYLVIAILSVFCCWPLAIVAIINATKVNKLIAAGDVTGAMVASANAKKWAFITIGLGLAAYVISAIIYVLIFAVAASS
jgi:hypothetical protein